MSDLLILSFFGLEEGRIFMVVLGGIMQQTMILQYFIRFFTIKLIVDKRIFGKIK